MILLSLLATLFFVAVGENVLAFGTAFAALILFIRSIYVDKAVYLQRIQEETQTARLEERSKGQKQYNELERTLKERLRNGEYLFNIEGQLILGRYHLNGQWEPGAVIKHGRVYPVARDIPVSDRA